MPRAPPATPRRLPLQRADAPTLHGADVPTLPGAGSAAGPVGSFAVGSTTLPVVPTLRLFAAAREAMATGALTLDGATVGDVVAAACALPGGDRLAAILPTCTVWLNGDPAQPGAAVGDGDEVAVLPPVSGGQ